MVVGDGGWAPLDQHRQRERARGKLSIISKAIGNAKNAKR